MKEVRIGRHPDNDVILGDNTVSKFHAILLIEGHTYIINDLHSRNGIFVNGTRIKGSTQLDILDIVKLGTALFAWKNHIYNSKIEDNQIILEPVNPVKIDYPSKSDFNKRLVPILLVAALITFFGVIYLITLV